MQADGSIAAFVDGYSVNLGQFSAAAMDRARNLTDGLPLASFAGKSAIARKSTSWCIDWRGTGCSNTASSFPRDEQDLVVIEPQVPEYWPQRAKLGDGDTVVLSRFAYLRRRGNEMVLESPRAGALFRIGDPAIAAALAALSTASEDQPASPPRGLLQTSICSNCCWIASSCSSSMRTAATAFG